MQGLSDDRTGQLIGGKYFIDGLLARGGMGLIYAARHSGTGRSVAVKILRPELAARSDLVRRVSAEARLAVEASHPNVVEVLDAGADDAGIPYVVLERLHGRALDAFIESPIALVPTVQALLPIVNALVSLHQAGIVHRDIKPSNIFLSRLRDGRITPKLLDFGIAKALEATGMTLSGTALGTPAYMAPEQALGAGDAGAATDVWSIAVVFVRCLTGRLPFEAPAQRRLGSLKAGLEPADLALVPAPLQRTLMRALRFEPSERFATMDEFRKEMLGALQLIDAGNAWPRIDTVSYAAEETLLSSWLGAISPDDSVPADLASHRRPANVETRTLPAVQTATSSSPAQPRPALRGRQLKLSLFALAALAALLVTSRVILREDGGAPALPKAPEALAESLAPAAAPAAPRDRAEQVRPGPAPEPATGAPAPREEISPDSSPGNQPTSTARSTAATAPRLAPPKDSKPEEGNAPPATGATLKPSFGANRARIIE